MHRQRWKEGKKKVSENGANGLSEGCNPVAFQRDDVQEQIG